jgi:hypothetical protein
VILFLAGLTSFVYGVGINLQGMLAGRTTDFSFITAHITKWLLILVAGLLLAITGIRKA